MKITRFLLALFLVSAAPVWAASVSEGRTRQSLVWELGAHAAREVPPAEWVPASVPGAVQLDWGRAKAYPDYTYSDNYKRYVWMEDSFWTYRTRLTVPDLAGGRRLYFVCGGVDYRFQIGVGETVLHDQEGMFTPVELDLTGKVRSGDELWVCVYPAPKSFRPDPDLNDRAAQRGQANRSTKPAMSYGWDFHPRLIPLGIWQDTYLEVRAANHLSSAELDYRLNEELSSAQITMTVKANGAGSGKIRWELLDPSGRTVLQQDHAMPGESLRWTSSLAAPQLWWPHDQGQPERYTSRVTLLDAEDKTVETRTQRVGFRRVRIIMNEGEWKQPSLFPKSRSRPPSTLEINGRPIFVKGANWVSPDIFPGTITRETYAHQLGLARAANMNLLRCWGGAPVMKESFFAIADELGIMLWQEFPLACNLYPDDPDYLQLLEQEARSIIGQLKHHPSVVLWCGGNELFNDWSRHTEQTLPIRLLDSLCFQLDPTRPFLPTSPIEGQAHGPYHFIDWSTNRESLALFAESDFTAYNEISTGAGLRPLDQLRRFIPEDELFPLRPTAAWVAHKAINPDGRALHLAPKNLEHYFGDSRSIEELIERSQFLMGEGLHLTLEEVRRKKMRTSMALVWCFNEPWPNAAGCGNLVTWYGPPMPALTLVGQAFRPVLASLKITKMTWSPGETFAAEVWLLSDAPVAVASGRAEVWLKTGAHEEKLGEWSFAETPAGRNQRGPTLSVRLPDDLPERFQVSVVVDGRPEVSSLYTLLRKR